MHFYNLKTHESIFVEADKLREARNLRYYFGLIEAARNHELNLMLTLTIDPKKVPAGINLIELLNQLFKYYVKFQRRLGANIYFIRVIERKAETSYFHIHAVIKGFIDPCEIWEKLTEEIGGKAHIVRPKRQDILKVYGYAFKSIVKGKALNSGARRFATSRNIALNTFVKTASGNWVNVDHIFRKFEQNIKVNIDKDMQPGKKAAKTFANKIYSDFLKKYAQNWLKMAKKHQKRAKYKPKAAKIPEKMAAAFGANNKKSGELWKQKSYQQAQNQVPLRFNFLGEIPKTSKTQLHNYLLFLKSQKRYRKLNEYLQSRA